jgi:hypothetical protein
VACEPPVALPPAVSLPIVCPNATGKEPICVKISPPEAKTNANKSIVHVLIYADDKTMLLIIPLVDIKPILRVVY